MTHWRTQAQALLGQIRHDPKLLALPIDTLVAVSMRARGFGIDRIGEALDLGPEEVRGLLDATRARAARTQWGKNLAAGAGPSRHRHKA